VNKAKRQLLLAALKMLDLTLAGLSFGLATVFVAYANQSVSLSEFLSMRVKLSNCLISLLLAAIWHALFSACGLYRSKRLSSTQEQVLDIAKATVLATASLGLAAAIFPIRMVGTLFLLGFFAFTSVFIMASRTLLKRVLTEFRRRGRNLRYVLILGTNAHAIDFARRIANPERGYRLLGFADNEWEGIELFKRTGFPLVCDLAGVPEFLRRNVVDEVAIYLPLRSSFEQALGMAALCEQHGITVRFDGDIFWLKTPQARRDELEGEEFVATNGAGRNWGALMIKRVLDVVISAVALVVLAPLFAIVAILIKRSAPGPVFFLQARVGLNKRKFSICKFRTMVTDAEKMLPALESQNEVSGPVFKIKDDPRITPLGRWLRRTSIDELPQLINVLKGDMSLVGPRPLPWRDYEGFHEDWQRRRFSVRPGITCLWQVNGRSSIPFEEWMKLDLQYMDEWSLLLDLKILAQTIPAVLKGSGAA
jgi:exopolysaccharide biosynthesis polyprenyl glycosylphosphotransferase